MFESKASKKSPHNILVVEDEGDMCLLLDILLNTKEAKVEHVKSLFDARMFLEHQQPELVLLDNRLPDGYGVDFISYIKTTYPSIKILMISGIDASAQDFALEVGADHFLTKPFTKEQLYHSVDHLLN